MLQRAAREVLERDERLPVLRADVVDRADAWMVQGRRGLRLALEAVERLRVLRQRFRQELERDGPAEPRILGFVHHPHATAAQLPGDAVMRERLADHAILISRGAAAGGGSHASQPFLLRTTSIVMS